jgi:hypothetical protein
MSIVDIILKPFSKGYVLRTTIKHMRKSVDMSIAKTFDRISDFGDNPIKQAEIFSTLQTLHILRKMLDDFQAHNPEIFKGE